MSDGVEASVVLANAIKDGTFPDSNDLLTSDLAARAIPALLGTISTVKEELSENIRQTSRGQANDVDQWILQARQAQDDIARCKQDARQIVEQHQRGQALRGKALDAVGKVELLKAEIVFTQTLEKELREVAAAQQGLKNVENLLSLGKATEAARALQTGHVQSDQIKGLRAKSLLSDTEDALRRHTLAYLEGGLDSRIATGREKSQIWLQVQNQGDDHVATDDLVQALENIGALPEASENVTRKIEAFVSQALRKIPHFNLSSHAIQASKFEIILGEEAPPIQEIIDFVKDVLIYLHSTLPSMLETAVIEQLLSKLIPSLISQWLSPAIPTELTELSQLDLLQRLTTEIVDLLKSHHWSSYAQLEDWVDLAPRTWLSKRKAETLNAVRQAFAASQGASRQVERVERQTISSVEPSSGENAEDWDANWDDEKQNETVHAGGNDDDTSGWGFEDDQDKQAESVSQQGGSEQPIDDDAGDSWGWDDENPDEKGDQPAHEATIKVNGTEAQTKATQEVTLTELYSITDIPDHLVEIIGKDIQDALAVQEEHHPSLKNIPAASGLLALPTLALAMFRATAPTYYSNARALGNMNLYNDSLYIVEKLRLLNVPSGLQTVESDGKAMEKFARSAYAKEMDTQRTILNDLLDGAQGFTSCTQFPYSQEIENAVTSTIDRIREVHREWKPILSTSALLQSIGALLLMVIAKVITDVEEMEDISEAQSQRLGAFCSQISALEDLFISMPPGASEHGEESIAMTAVYVSNWLRFQYLINILESSLVDIKFLWTEGELSLEFSQDEVTDLIKALFAESSHRRSAIAAIKGHRGSGL